MRAVAVRPVGVGAVLLLSACALAYGQTVPGEKWKQKISVTMEGLSMPMGGGEICVPIGQTEGLLKPDEECTTSDVEVVGNTMSATVTCTGEDAMRGTVQLTVAGDTVSGKAQMTTEDGDEMVLLMESTKLGPCQAIDTRAVAAKASSDAMAAARADLDVCSSARAMFENDPSKAGAMAPMFVEPGQPCSTRPADPAFCAALNTRSGFSGLIHVDKYSPGIGGKSATACGLGSVDELRASLVREAEADGDEKFVIENAPARAAELVRSECVIKGEMWAGKTAKWDGLCDSNFAAEVRGDR